MLHTQNQVIKDNIFDYISQIYIENISATNIYPVKFIGFCLRYYIFLKW